MSTINNTNNKKTTNLTAPGGLTNLIADLDIADSMKYVFFAQGSLIITINLTLVAFITLRKRLRKNQKNVFLASLFLSHSIIGVLCCLLPIKQAKKVFLTDIMDFGNTAMLSSFCNLMLVTMDRFIAIRFPMFYNKTTTKTVLTALIIVWLIPLAFLLSTLAIKRLPQLTFVLITIISMTALLVENSLIYCIVRKQVKNIKSVRVASNELLEDEQRLNMVTTHQTNHHRAFFICLAMVLSYVIAWLPATVYVFYGLLTAQNVEIDRAYLNLIVFLVLSNSISDPIIYTWFNRNLKLSLKEFIHEGGRATTQTQLFVQEGRPRAQTQLSVVMEN